jgi:hypothetical protein
MRLIISGVTGSGIAKRLLRVALVFLLALLYRQLQAPPPKIPGTPGGPPVTSPRIKLQDGRHLAYYESGVPKDQAKHKIIFVHGFDSCRYDVLRVSPVRLSDRSAAGDEDEIPVALVVY